MVLAKQFDLKSFVLRFPLGLLSGVRAIQKKTLACHFIYQIKLGSLRRVALWRHHKSLMAARALNNPLRPRVAPRKNEVVLAWECATCTIFSAAAATAANERSKRNGGKWSK
jgi:hypothetical protein